MHSATVPPFPAELVSESPMIAAFTALEFGALMALALAYWKLQCREMPSEDSVLAVVARCHQRRWYDCRDKVIPVWRALQPAIAAVYAKRTQILTQRQANAELGLVALAEYRNRTARKAAKPLAEAQSDSLAPLVPQRSELRAESRTNSGESIPKRTLRGQSGALLTD